MVNRSQPLMGRSSLYCSLTSYFPIVDICLNCEDTARQSCDGARMANFWRFFASCIFSEPRAAQTYILNSHSGNIMCGSIVDTQSATAENRRGKKKKLECGPMPNVMAAQPNIGGAVCDISEISFPVPRHKVWLTVAARVPWSNAATIGERKTWTYTEFCTWQIPSGIRAPKMYI